MLTGSAASAKCAEYGGPVASNLTGLTQNELLMLYESRWKSDRCAVQFYHVSWTVSTLTVGVMHEQQMICDTLYSWVLSKKLSVFKKTRKVKNMHGLLTVGKNESWMGRIGPGKNDVRSQIESRTRFRFFYYNFVR